MTISDSTFLNLPFYTHMTRDLVSFVIPPWLQVHACLLRHFPFFLGLRNDNEPETLALKYKTNAIVFPCQYIKIVPLMAWGANFNFSIWHVQVKGIPDPEMVQETYLQYINVS